MHDVCMGTVYVRASIWPELFQTLADEARPFYIMYRRGMEGTHASVLPANVRDLGSGPPTRTAREPRERPRSKPETPCAEYVMVSEHCTALYCKLYRISP